NMDYFNFPDYTAQGYVIARGVFTAAEAAAMAAHYMQVSAAGPHPGDFAGVPTRSTQAAAEPLARYPRLINMHNWDAQTRAWMCDQRLVDSVSALFGQPARVLQTMVYFKPPGSRGQSMHQDNLYLRTTPVAAAWVALDRADAENGAMEMLRGSHLLGLLPCQRADTDLSFTDSETVAPPWLERDLIALEPGDVVFFHGLTVHGSPPNHTADRFRRSFIVHYVGETAYPIVGPTLPRDEG
ncbi:MAG TPA: phytanoyl-CoA dioxygenase family protein, partial [Chloroflexota bacterium]|nr:phytanoyl-CoA dioxygenase family protein [Chloroflexota bacterium]